MYVEHSDQQLALRAELKAYFQILMTAELIEATRGAESGEAYKQVIRQLGKDGWLAIGWPSEYGGRGFSHQEQLIFFEEAQLACVPLPFVTINTVAPALMMGGSDHHKKLFLPKIAAGELHFAIAYTESEAGTDLASLKTTAVKDGDDYVINGTKVFTSGAEGADYIWLAARTADTPKPHQGITIFLVDASIPGFSYSPVKTVGNIHTNITYYDQMRVPKNMIAGELNGGWKLITSQLNHERVGLAAIGINGIGLYERTLQWARKADNDNNDKRPIDECWIQSNLAKANNLLEAMRLMNWRMTWSLDQGTPDPAFASAIKVYSTEAVIEVYRLLMEIVGSRSTLQRNNVASVLNGDLEEAYRKCQINTFGGGVAELMRDLVASFGLGMATQRRR